ncbi:MAG: phenylalanine--tRNA ligase subunit alpha [Candidatus Bathyarchaeota archaeon]
MVLKEGKYLSQLHHLERAVLLALGDGKKISVGELSTKAGLPEASIFRATLWLSSKGYIQVEADKQTLISIGSEGERFLLAGFPERILVEAIVDAGGKLPLEEVSALSNQDKGEVNIALGWARRKGWLKIVQEGGRPVLVVVEKPEKGLDEMLIETVSQRTLTAETLDPRLVEGLNTLKGRPNAIKLTESVERFFILTPSGLKAARKISEEFADHPSSTTVKDEVSQLTPELIKSGKWRDVRFRRYNIQSPAVDVWPGKKQPFLRFLDELKWKLAVLGFKEMEGPVVEFMFFNCDALFMPQDHPAREIHDIYYVKCPSEGDLSPYTDLVKKVKLAHENGWKTGSKGWGYRFSLKETEKLILRSQGTALSARMLLDEKLEIPGKYFSISRCYRPDVVDRTHLTEFNQIEGIVLGEKLTFRDLLGVLEKFALDIAGAEKIKFRPDYFPFTEPSVELVAYKEGFGWIEFGGAGMFRPEMTLPLGINVPVIAWGLGVNRIFMMKNDISDIRDIFTQNLEWLRMQRVT